MLDFPPYSLQIKKEVSFKIHSHDDTQLHLNLTFLKSWANQCIFLMEMFVLSYVNEPCIYPRPSSGHVWMWELDLKKAEHRKIDAFKLWC